MNVRTLLCTAALAGSFLLPIAAHAQEDPCAGVYDYTVAVVDATAPFIETSEAIGFGGDRDPATISGAEWGQLGDAADASLLAVDAITPPPSVAEFHRETKEFLGLMSNFTHTVETGGPMAALQYSDPLTTAMDELNATDSPISLGCLNADAGASS